MKDEEWTKVEVEGSVKRQPGRFMLFFYIAQAVEMGTTPLTKGEKKPNVNSYLAM
jgi:hypothetical protein